MTDPESLLPERFRPTRQELDDTTERLARAYQDYIKHVSPQQMTIALETCAYILWASTKIDVKSAADFGSGFTSYVLRLVCDDVWSIDDNQEWLDWTITFLERYDQGKGSLFTWDEYRARDDLRERRDIKFDLIVYDFSSGEMRDNNFMHAIGQLRPGGIAILDDANHQEHQISMHKAAAKYHYGLFGLQDYTRDFFRRFAALVVAE